MSDEGDCRIAPATLGLLNISRLQNLEKFSLLDECDREEEKTLFLSWLDVSWAMVLALPFRREK